MNAPVQAAVLTANADRAAVAAAQIVEEVRQASAEPSWLAATRRVAQVAAQHAAAVDREARFPVEAFEAMRRERLLSAMVPAELGGAGLTLSEVACICETLAHACSSTAMVYAMHQSQVACLSDQGNDVPWIRQMIARMIDEQWLLASATSEETIGGNMRTSACAVELTDGAFRIEKLAPTISYGAHADCILVTARRSAEASASDQVLIVAPRDTLVLEKRGGWDSLGMRGTCSEAFRLIATGRAEQILPVPFAQVADQTMLPVSHTLWAAVWVGITSDAVNRAHQFFRTQARGKPGALPPSAGRLANAVAQLRMMQARLKDALDAASVASSERVARDAREACDFDTPLGASLSLASDMNTLKLSISSAALEVVQETLMICGMAGYKNNTEYSVGRHLRDLFSAPLMISNDRIQLNTANLLLAQRTPATGRI
ncbi:MULTISPECIES: acyl-CoA dehydrogenase family protein [Burkholderiaceae]|uniref:Acyl-CoA dehydrogenase, short-chain specific n=1 Tax=Caballeronia sordidicola TaxID=196367 RepID=A0A242MLW4_CABSO|nr:MULTISPECIES: acyl-CoA dehydrogenase family protein [Burkholderiaceae]AME24893.1 acyl-CoA dehydrogenase [Burkholderia sp. PAMC 26561]OTP72191.1 Acyl-CoA dehydrogenase, short-chain specific [Caballeronia sordidicola]